MKNQISLDYLMVFIFILFIFILIFASVAKQRILVSSQQTFSQLQLVAQSIASDLSAAALAGNGYTASILLPPQLAVLSYNVSITRHGLIIASSNVLGQTVQATAVSLVQNIVSNSIYLSANKQFYVIPTVQSTGFITLQNSFGTLCIDYQCPSTSNQSSQLSLSDQLTSSLQLNGFTTNAVYMGPITPLSTETVSFWMKPNVVPVIGSQYVVDQGQPGTPSDNWIAVQSGKVVAGPSSLFLCGSVVTVQPNKWYFVTYTVNSLVMNLYINGNVMLGCNTAVTPAVPQYLNIGQIAGASTRFNGSIANMQIYSIALSANQVLGLYNGGITGPPVYSANYLAANVVAWYPFSGNGNDYSGNGKNLVVNSLSYYPAVGQVYANVGNNTNIGLSNVSVGYITNSGSFQFGQSAANATNGNGLSYEMINQGANSSVAYIKASAFNGNSFTKANVVAWWPMSDGQGLITHDISNNSNSYNALNGNIVGAFWSNPNFAAQFDGQTSLIQIQNVPKLQVATLTVSAWVKYNGPSGTYSYAISRLGAWELGACNQNLQVCFYDPNLGQTTLYNSQLNSGQWYMLTEVLDNPGQTVSTYVDGILTGTATATSLSVTGNGIQVGYSNIASNSFFFNGSVANLQIYSTKLSSTQIYNLFKNGIASIPYQTNLVGWWPLDGDALDYSPNPTNGIIYGNLNMLPPSIQNTQSSQILSASFNGVSSYSSGSTDANAMPSYNVVVSAWIKTSSGSATTQAVAFAGSSGASPGYQLYLSNSHFATFLATPTGAATCVVTQTGSNPLNDNQWHLITGTYNGMSTQIFVDGILSNVQSCSGSTKSLNYGGGATVLIGTNSKTLGNEFFSGYISNVQVYNGILTNPQILQIYKQGFAEFPIVNTGLSAWWPLNGDPNDYSIYNFNSAPVNVVYFVQSSSQPYLKPSFGGAGLSFNGLGGNVIVNKNVPIKGRFTVSAWINPGTASGRETILGKSGIFELDLNSAGSMEGDFYTTLAGANPVKTPYSLNAGQWYMLTGEWNGTFISIYLNGFPANIMPATGLILPNTNPTLIGSTEYSPYNGNFFNGTIADVQVYNNSLTSSQIYQLYNSGAPPTGSVSIPLGATP